MFRGVTPVPVAWAPFLPFWQATPQLNVRSIPLVPCVLCEFCNIRQQSYSHCFTLGNVVVVLFAFAAPEESAKVVHIRVKVARHESEK